MGRPTSILVRLPTGATAAAKLVARDQNRLLVLLQVDVENPLPVPTAVPREEFRVGCWAIALGRTWREDRVGISTGIISGLNRRYGRVLQTDCSVSAANYGGPLIDVDGRVYGILVPMAPDADGAASQQELAGAENYDAGIGFAVPLVDVLAVLPRWQQGEDLLPGKLGIGLVTGGVHLQPPRIGSVWPNSPAAAADWRPGDVIVAVEGVPVGTQAQLHFQLVPRYAGDVLNVQLERDGRPFTSRVTLAGELAPYKPPFLGIFPGQLRQPPELPGVLVRGVWPDGPAARAGVQAGDRLLQIESMKIERLDDVWPALVRQHPEDAVELLLLRKQRQRTVTATLGTLPDQRLSAAEFSPRAAEKKSPEEPIKLAPLKLPTFSQQASFYQPTCPPQSRQGLLLWLGDGTTATDQRLLATWQASCQRDQLVLLIAHPAEEAHWRSEDLKYLQALVGVASRRFGTVAERTVIGGAGKAGQLALAVGLRQQSAFAGAMGLDAPLPRTQIIPPTQPQQRLALLAVGSHDSAWVPLIRRDLQRLRAAGYSASWLQRPPVGLRPATLDPDTQAAIARWIDTLDRF